MEGTSALNGHAPAVKAGGMRVSQATHRTPLKDNANPAHLSKAHLEEHAKGGHNLAEDPEVKRVEQSKGQESFQRFQDMSENTMPKNNLHTNDGKRKDVFQPAKNMQH
ncbi:hypothetical protein DSO57_1002096 [Entomophthora muscae]|uniref:Uncharacterized protein n=1 Tax=Entomophthora muscae TaxID=34485 RepID=A0ACC2RZS4_9FUNG|nr:hypothetical protein DSO57_1002096 [Entomophthora muscae]